MTGVHACKHHFSECFLRFFRLIHIFFEQSHFYKLLLCYMELRLPIRPIICKTQTRHNDSRQILKLHRVDLSAGHRAHHFAAFTHSAYSIGIVEATCFAYLTANPFSSRVVRYPDASHFASNTTPAAESTLLIMPLMI